MIEVMNQGFIIGGIILMVGYFVQEALSFVRSI